MNSPRPVVGLLLAAGRGRRFDPDGFADKLLADARGASVASRSATTLAAACDRVVAVVRPGADALRATLGDAGVADIVECADADRGMGHSLSRGAHAAVRLAPRRIVVALADMPWIDRATIARLVAAADTDPASDAIVVPVHAGRRGHPVVFGPVHLAGLMRCDGDRGAAALLAEYPVRHITVDDPGVNRDVDTPADLLPPVAQ